MKSVESGEQEDSLLGGSVHSNTHIRRHRTGNHCPAGKYLLVVITSLIGLVILVGTFCFRSGDTTTMVKRDQGSDGDSITLGEIVSNALIPSLVDGQWISDHEFMHIEQCSQIENCKLSLVINDMTVLSNTVVHRLYTNDTYGHTYDISSDGRFLLTSANRKSMFRYSSTADYFFLNLTSKEHVAIGPSDQHYIRFAAFGPRGTQMVFGRAGDLHYKRSMREKETTILNSVSTGPGRGFSMSNGIPDWMYEEEILRRDRSFWFSPSGSRLAFLSIDNSAVPVASVLHVGHETARESEHLTFSYPRPGEPIPVTSLWVSDLDSDGYETVPIPAPREMESGQCYFTGAVWADDNRLLVSWMSRNQTKSYLMSCSLSTSVRRSFQSHSTQPCMYVLKEESNGMWTDPIIPVPSSDGLEIAVIQQNEGSDSHEIAVLDFRENHNIVTRADLDVTKVHAFNAGHVYFEAVPEDFPRTKHVYQASSRGYDVRCLTCQFRGCDYNDAVFSGEGSFFLHRCLGPAFPFAQIIDATTGLSKAILQDNQELKERLSKKTTLTSHVFEVPVTEFWNASLKLYSRTESWVSGNKYPLLLHLYNAPESVWVTEKHTSLEDPFGVFMSQAEHVIFGKMDVRGSGNQGLSRLREIQGKLGEVEVADILTVIRYIKEHLPQVDPKRIAVYGTSYGGFATLRALMRDQDSLIACGVAIAPVVDWRLYDAFYSEKYLSSPAVHQELYYKSSVLEHVGQLKGKKLMIAHGSYDDNVHIENSLKLVKKMVDEGIEHTFLVLPDEVHYLRNPNMKLHLLQSVHKFLKHECFPEKHHSHLHHH